MASLRHIERTGYWQIRFYWQGKQHQLACATKRQAEANRILAVVEDTLQLLSTGRLEVPPDVDPVSWIISGGKVSAKTTSIPKDQTFQFGHVCDE